MEEPLLSPSWRNSTPWCLSCMSRCSDVIIAVKTNVMVIVTSFTIIAVPLKTDYMTVTQDIRHKQDKNSLIGLSLIIHPDMTSAKWLPNVIVVVIQILIVFSDYIKTDFHHILHVVWLYCYTIAFAHPKPLHWKKTSATIKDSVLLNLTDWHQYLPPGGDARHQRQVGHEEPLWHSDLQNQAKRCLQKGNNMKLKV